ncbi:hypothetical protein ACFV11_27190 [Streptomyces globisporus]|uniref:hypothetical protein n=1 Tax=Streptomyces globisporus TaxID=1908 RepID=UPI0036C531B1
MTNVDDVVQERIAAAARKREQEQQQRAELGQARQRGVSARHKAALERLAHSEQLGARVALAALRRDARGVALALANVEPGEVRRVAGVALAAITELALTAPAANVATTTKALAEMAARPTRGVGESKSLVQIAGDPPR